MNYEPPRRSSSPVTSIRGFSCSAFSCRGSRFSSPRSSSAIIRPIRCRLLFNFLGWLFVPRFLMAYYIYVNAGTSNIWFWAYIILGIAGMVGETGYVHRRFIRRTTTVNPDGSRTIVEEEEV